MASLQVACLLAARHLRRAGLGQSRSHHSVGSRCGLQRPWAAAATKFRRHPWRDGAVPTEPKGPKERSALSLKEGIADSIGMRLANLIGMWMTTTG